MFKYEKNHLGQNLIILPRLISTWFAISLGLVYGSGFLCVSTFLNHFRIHEDGGELFRAKYIYVGILFWMLPVSIIIPALLCVSIRRSSRTYDSDSKNLTNETKYRRFYTSSVVIFINMLFVFYVFVMFAPPGFVEGKRYIIPLIFMLSIFGQMAINHLAENRSSHMAGWLRESSVFNKIKRFHLSQHGVSFALRWTFALTLVFTLDFLAFWGMWLTLWQIIFGSEALNTFFFFMYLIVIVLQTVNIVASGGIGVRIALCAISLVLCIVELYQLKVSSCDWSDISYFLCILALVVSTQLALWIRNRRIQLFALILAVAIAILQYISADISTGALSYFAFMGLIPFIIRRINLWCRRVDTWRAPPEEIERSKTEARVALVALCFAFCFLGNLAFAWSIYPYIPASKGGGDFFYSPRISISLGAQNSLERQLSSRNSFVILEQTSQVFYLADVRDAGGPSMWRSMTIDNTPKTIEVQRDLVHEIVYNVEN